MRFYVDASWDNRSKIGAWSVVQVVRGKPHTILSGRVYGKDMNNLDVELIAAMKALEYAKKKKLNHITLCHDYTGTARIAMGERMLDSETAQRYMEFLKNSNLDVNFVQVKDTTDRFMKLAHKVAYTALKKRKNRRRRLERLKARARS